MREGRFDIRQFFEDLAIPKPEQTEVTDCLVRGVASYYEHIYGYDKYGEYPDFMVEERMYEPYIFGFGAVQVVRRSTLSNETRLKVVQYTLQQTRPMEEYGTPHGLTALLSFLARVGVLEVPLFRTIMQIATLERRDLFDDWEKDEMLSLLNWMVTKANLPQSEQVWWIQHISSQCDKPQRGKALMEHLLNHPALSVEFKRELCWAWLSKKPVGEAPAQWKALEAMLQGDASGVNAILSELSPQEQPLIQVDTENLKNLDTVQPSLGFSTTLWLGGGFFLAIAPYMQRRALLGLVQLGEDPLSICETFLDSDRRYNADAINQGVADVIHEFHQSMPQKAVQKLVEKGLKIPQVNTRKSFYQLGADLFGSEYWTRAQNDNSKNIRDWAAKKAAGGVIQKQKRKKKAES
jgi:hypothetical protein